MITIIEIGVYVDGTYVKSIYTNMDDECEALEVAKEMVQIEYVVEYIR